MESMMTARQVAELLGVHENWVYDQAASGGLPSYKIGGARRFDRDELRDWIAEHRQTETARHAPSRNATIAASTARQRVQHAERRPEVEQAARASRRRHAKADRDADAQPAARLFEI